jgi:rubrerythrin
MKKSSSRRNLRGNSRANNHASSRNHRGTRSQSSSRSSSRAASRGRGHGISEKWLRDFLSEMYAVEQGGEKLYRKALDELEHEDLRRQLERFHQQTERHVELCMDMMRAAGVEQDYMSPAAKAAEQKAEGLLSTEIEDDMTKAPPVMSARDRPDEQLNKLTSLRDQNNIENLVLAETKDHWNWEMLSSIAGKIRERDLKNAVRKAVSEVRKQERDHLKWAQDTLSKLAMEKAQQPDVTETEPASEQAESGQEW